VSAFCLDFARTACPNCPVQRLIRTFFAMLALAAVMVIGLGFYAQRTAARLSGRTVQVLRENYDSVTFMDQALSGLADEERLVMRHIAGQKNRNERPPGMLHQELLKVRERVELAIRKEAANVTLPGEAEAAGRLQSAAMRYHENLLALATDVDAGTTSLQAHLARHEQTVEPLRAEAGKWAQHIRLMNHEYMERIARQQAESAPRYILLGTFIAVSALLAGGVRLARRLHRQARDFQALRTHFVAIASHELRTPVTSLKMGLDLLGSEAVGQLNDEQRGVVDAGIEDCDRLLALSRQLLDVTKIQSGQLEVHRVAVELRQLVADSVKAVRRTVQEKRITVDVDVDALPPGTRVDADPTKAAWVITNLLANGLRYAPVEGSVCVTARLVSSGKLGGKNVAVSISDTGPGIAPEIARKVFQPYFQAGVSAEGAHTTEPDGVKRGNVGLGLAIAQEIVAAHEGRIWVEPVPLLGHGATVTFTLPVAHEEA
jgi:signal transduction histidine kinase